MKAQTLSAVLEQEHRTIDDDIERVAKAATITAADRSGLSRAIALLRRHIYAEEELLFPPLREAGMYGPVLVMLREHAEMWEVLDVLDRALGDADPDVQNLALTCRGLLAQLQAHNPKEEAILYPQADTVLDADAIAQLRAFLADGQIPPGWTCHGQERRGPGRVVLGG